MDASEGQRCESETQRWLMGRLDALIDAGIAGMVARLADCLGHTPNDAVVTGLMTGGGAMIFVVLAMTSIFRPRCSLSLSTSSGTT